MMRQRRVTFLPVASHNPKRFPCLASADGHAAKFLGHRKQAIDSGLVWGRDIDKGVHESHLQISMHQYQQHYGALTTEHSAEAISRLPEKMRRAGLSNMDPDA